jgi:hypothetical protein
MFFDYPFPASSPSSACSMAAFQFTPLHARDVGAYAMANAFHRISFHDVQDVNPMSIAPLDVGVDWGFLDELDQAAWLRDSIVSCSSGSSVASYAPPLPAAIGMLGPRTRCKRLRCPGELARRLEHRRSLQKGYEKTYRQRKRKSREELRTEWVGLEYELKHKLVVAQNSVVYHPDACVTGEQSPPELTELDAECTALRMEQAVLESMLVTEARLETAGDYFTQSKMREKLNALATTPSLMGYNFEW